MLPDSDRHIEDAYLARIMSDQITSTDTEIDHYITVRIDNGRDPSSLDYNWRRYCVGEHDEEVYVTTSSNEVEGVSIYDVEETQNVLDTIADYVSRFDLNVEIAEEGETFRELKEYDEITLPEGLQ